MSAVCKVIRNNTVAIIELPYGIVVAHFVQEGFISTDELQINLDAVGPAPYVTGSSFRAETFDARYRAFNAHKMIKLIHLLLKRDDKNSVPILIEGIRNSGKQDLANKVQTEWTLEGGEYEDPWDYLEYM